MNHFESSVINLIWTKKLVLLYKEKNCTTLTPVACYKSFKIVIYNHNGSTIVICDCNEGGPLL